MKKKVVTIVLSAVMAAGLLAGCGSGNSSGSDTSAENVENSPEAEAAADGGTLKVMMVGTAEDVGTEGKRELCRRFSENNEYGVTVELELYQTEQYKTKLTTLMASNALPDVFLTWELAYLEPFVDGGKVADITSYLEADQEWKESFADGTLDLLAYDGKNYGIPTNKTLCVMFYNKRIFEEQNVEVPTTYEEFLQVCETMRERGIIPMAMSGTSAWIPAQFVQQIAGGMAGDGLFKAICNGEEKWNNETHVKAAEEVKKMADAGYFQDGYIGMSPEETMDLFTTGQAAMHFYGSYNAVRFASEMGEDVGVFVMPAYDPQYNNISVGSVNISFAVAESSDKKDAAVDFLKFWTSQESEEYMLYEYGDMPSVIFEIDESKLQPVVSEVTRLSNEQVGLTPWWDRQFGAGEGVEFNNTCVAVLGGEDAQTAFDALQQFADDNTAR